MMKLDFRHGLLFVSVTLSFNGKSHTVDDVILDTGAAHSLFDRTTGEPLDLVPDNHDINVTMAGLGGTIMQCARKSNALISQVVRSHSRTLTLGIWMHILALTVSSVPIF